MLKIWTPQGELLRTPNMWNVWPKGYQLHGKRLFQQNKTKCSKCQENHPTFSRICNILKNKQTKKKQGEIMKWKFKRNITFLDAGKIVKSNMKVNTYANVVQKASPISNKNNCTDQYRALIENYSQLKSNKNKKNPQQTQNYFPQNINRKLQNLQLK